VADRGETSVGCAIAPYAISARRVLVIAPGTRIRGQLGNDLRANSPTKFYERCRTFPEAHAAFPETMIIATGRVNLDDIRHCETGAQ
jgi:hypothetical protein